MKGTDKMNVDMSKALAIVDKLIGAGLVDDIFNIEKSFYVSDWFLDHEYLGLNCTVHSGASKGVLVFEDTDWVIKFDYYSDSCSYCEVEAENYKSAVSEGLAHYFAETIMIKKVGDVAFTVQEKCECDEDAIHDKLYDSLKRRYADQGEEKSNDDLWDEVNLICEDGCCHEMFEDAELNAFVRRYYINDLHQANFGRINGRYVMIDYSGF